MPPPPKPRRGPAARPPVEIKVEENIQKEISVNEAAENAEEVLPVVQPKTESGKKEAAKGGSCSCRNTAGGASATGTR